jgi:hypothetical protein
MKQPATLFSILWKVNLIDLSQMKAISDRECNPKNSPSDHPCGRRISRKELSTHMVASAVRMGVLNSLYYTRHSFFSPKPDALCRF